MSKEAIIKFMEGADTYPDITGVYPPRSEENKQLLLLILRKLQEETQEHIDGLEEDDWKEGFDGLLDQLYVLQQVKIIYEILGFDVVGGLNEVCDNNAMKVFNSEEHAILEWARWEEKQVGKCVIHPSPSSEGQVFTLRDVETGFVSKPVDHPKPDLVQYMPEEFVDNKED